MTCPQLVMLVCADGRKLIWRLEGFHRDGETPSYAFCGEYR